MARRNDRDDDRKPKYPLGFITVEGNTTKREPRDMSSDEDQTFIGFKMLATSTNYKGEEFTIPVDVSIGNAALAQNMYQTLMDAADNDESLRLCVSGNVYVNEWEDDDEEVHVELVVEATHCGPSGRFNTYTKGDSASGGGSSSGEGRSRRRRSGDDDEKGSGNRASRRRGRGSDSDDDESGSTGSGRRSSGARSSSSRRSSGGGNPSRSRGRAKVHEEDEDDALDD